MKKISELVKTLAESDGGSVTYYDDQIDWDLSPSEVVKQEGWGNTVQVSLKSEGFSTKIEVVVFPIQEGTN